MPPGRVMPECGAAQTASVAPFNQVTQLIVILHPRTS